ncbi:MAG: N-acetylmuramoyl-L-alanine amidase [Lentimonas sp.]|jgi:N-acetylmuramoyl-L-alanine amidase
MRSFILFFVSALPLFGTVEVQLSGRSYTELGSVASHFGMNGYWLQDFKSYRLKSQWTTVDLRENTRVLQLNRMPVYLGFPALKQAGKLYLSGSDYQHSLQSILTPQVFGAPPKLHRIVIDAGHGGKDSGARNDAYGLKEKELTLDVAQRLQRRLLQAGYEIVMTRDSDEYIPLEHRPQYANRSHADLFISIHFNAAGSATASGFESFALTPQYQASSKYPKPGRGDGVAYAGNKQDPWNTLLSYHVQRSLVEAIDSADRGLKRARFVVLKYLECPGVLVEMGFVSNLATAQKLRTVAYREKLAEALFQGILAYQARLDRI